MVGYDFSVNFSDESFNNEFVYCIAVIKTAVDVSGFVDKYLTSEIHVIISHTCYNDENLD